MSIPMIISTCKLGIVYLAYIQVSNFFFRFMHYDQQCQFQRLVWQKWVRHRWRYVFVL